MRKTVCLVGCSKEKLAQAAPAKDLYCSVLFRLCRNWAERNADAWAILSGKHLLVDPDEVIEPYDRSIRERRPFDQRRPLSSKDFAQCVYAAVQGWACRFATPTEGPRLVVLAGQDYWQWIDGHFDMERPLDGLGIGQRLRWLRQELSFKADAERIARSIVAYRIAALTNASVRALIEKGTWSEAEVHKNPPVRARFQHGWILCDVGSVCGAVRYAGRRGMGELVQVGPLLPDDQVNPYFLLRSFDDTHPRAIRWANRMTLKAVLGSLAPLVGRAMRDPLHRFLSRLTIDERRGLRSRCRFAPEIFWRSVRQGEPSAVESSAPLLPFTEVP